MTAAREPGRRLPLPDEEKIDAEIGQRIKEARIIASMSQSDLAEAVGVSFQQVQKYESGRNRLSASRLLTFARALRCDPMYLLGGASPPPPAAADELRDKLDLIRSWSKLSPREQTLTIQFIRIMGKRKLEPA